MSEVDLHGASLIDLDRERSIGEILRATLVLYRAFLLLFLILAAAVIVPYDLGVLALTGHGPFGSAHDSFVVRQLLTVLGFSLISPASIRTSFPASRFDRPHLLLFVPIESVRRGGGAAPLKVFAFC